MYVKKKYIYVYMMRPRRPKQYCLQLVINIYIKNIYIKIYIYIKCNIVTFVKQCLKRRSRAMYILWEQFYLSFSSHNIYIYIYIYIHTRAIIHRSPQRTYLPASTNDFHPFHQTKLHSTKPPPRTKKHLTKADTNTPSTTNPPRLPNAKTGSEATSSGTTLHSARTSAPISDTNSSA